MPSRSAPTRGASFALATLLLLAIGNAADAADVTLDASRRALRQATQHASTLPRPALIARGDFLQRSPITDVQLSPDGRHLLFRRRGEQRSELMLLEIDSATERRVLAEAGKVEAHWSGDGQRLWLADAVGLAVYELANAQPRRLHKWDRQREQGLWSIDARAPGVAVISEKFAHDGAQRYRYLRIDASGSTQPLYASAQPLRGALLGSDGQLAFTAGYEGPDYDTVIRRHDADGARELLRCHGIEQCRLVAASASGDALWLLSNHGQDKLQLQQWQARDGRWRSLHRDPDDIADASALLWRPGGEWQAIAYHPDRRRWHGRDAGVSAQLASLQRQLPEANLQLESSSDGGRWLVRAQHPTRAQDRYFLYATAADQLQPLFDADSNPRAPAPEQLSPVVAIRYRASDGLLLHAYVTLPRGIDSAQAPLIALIHGGPYNRDRDDYDAVAQLLANRGHVVLQPNFRASTGYGLRHLRAAGGDFGKGKVLSDIVEGLDYLLAQGIGDGERQAVMGHSFGGYASLLAVSHHPDRFRFAVASAAPADFTWGMEWIAKNGGNAVPEDGPPPAMFMQQFGMPLSDANWRAAMKRESPLARLPALQTPIHLWAGRLDDRVPPMEIVAFAGEAKRHGKAIELLIDPDSGHNPEHLLSLEALVYLIESAAHRHFGSAMTPPSPTLEAFLQRNRRIGMSENDVR